MDSTRRRLPGRGAGLWCLLVAMVVLEGRGLGDPWWALAIAAGLLGVAVRLRGSAPLVALGISAGLTITSVLVGFGTDGGVAIAYVPAMSLMSYLAGRRSGRLRTFALVVAGGNAVLLVGLLVTADGAVTDPILSWFLLALLSLLFVVLPWFAGRYRTQRDLLASAGWERAERMEREQLMVVEEARLRERSRIAQDMHDSVGHELSLIALRAGALEVDPELAERHRTAAAELREAAATATERLGEIIGVLREDDAAPTRPAGEGIAGLVDRAAASGLDVRLVLEGPPGALAPMADGAAHRVVQESLTNAAKHAPGAPVTVTLRRSADAVDVVVRNGAPLRPVPHQPASGRRGLLGLAERVRLVGGSLSTGAAADGGFEVAARIPRDGGPDEAGWPEGGVPAASGSASERATVRRTARRGLITAVAAPVGLAAALGAIAFGYYIAIATASVLEPGDYDALRIGQPRAEVEARLPRFQMLDGPTETTVPVPPGATCEYYRPDGPFSINFAYRLCFAGGRLVSKDEIRTGSAEPTPEGTTR